MKRMFYKDYCGSVEYSEDDECWFGKVLGIKSLLTYEGSDPDELRRDFEECIDQYLYVCALHKIKPEPPVCDL